MWASSLLSAARREPCILVTVLAVHGSAPRAPGSRMLVTRDASEGSIGGGNLEFEAESVARGMLESSPGGPACRREIYGLGPALGQCCGGAVILLYEIMDSDDLGWLERVATAQSGGQALVLITAGAADSPVSRWLLEPGETPPDALPEPIAAALTGLREDGPTPVTSCECDGREYLVEHIGRERIPLALFGAGHVGSAVARVLEHLPFQVAWIDSREDRLIPDPGSGIERRHCPDPAGAVREFPPGTVYVVMTHSHEVDEDICHEVLRRGDFAWLGLIGSATKRRRFAQRLGQRGMGEDALERLVCPIGASGVTGKRPATIAVALAAQLLRDVVPGPLR